MARHWFETYDTLKRYTTALVNYNLEIGSIIDYVVNYCFISSTPTYSYPQFQMRISVENFGLKKNTYTCCAGKRQWYNNHSTRHLAELTNHRFKVMNIWYITKKIIFNFAGTKFVTFLTNNKPITNTSMQISYNDKNIKVPL